MWNITLSRPQKHHNWFWGRNDIIIKWLKVWVLRNITLSRPQKHHNWFWGRNNIIEEYVGIFTSIRELKGVTVKLHVEPNVLGTEQKQKTRLLLLKDKFDKILEKCREMDVKVKG